MRVNMFDDQANLAFIRNQATHIESGVYAQRYPDIQYPTLIPVDTSAPEWAASVTYMSSDARGYAAWIGGKAMDIPNVSQVLRESQTGIHMAGVGYEYGMQEVGMARQMGISLLPDRAQTARRVSEEFIEQVAFLGDTLKGFKGLINNADITPANVAQNAGATSRLWSAKTPLEVMIDLNEILTDIWSDSFQIENADTLLLSPERWAYLVNTPMSVDSTETIYTRFMKTNILVATGRTLMMRAVRGLETAGASGTQRMIAYTRDPSVLKLHLPMPHRFLPVYNKGLFYEVPGIFRFGGVDIRRPGAVRYRDGF